MADTYGVKVKLQITNDKTDLRLQLQTLLNEAISASPLQLNKFKVGKGNFREAINQAIGDFNKDGKHNQIQLDHVTFKATSEAVKKLQDELKAKDLELTIGKINADKAVANLRADLVKMLSGLNIGGVKEFLGDTGIKEDNKEVVSYTANLQRLQGMLSALKKVNTKLNTFGDAEGVQEMLTLYGQLNNEINLAIAAGGQWENIDGLQTQVLQLNDMLAAYQQLIAAQKESAAQADKSASAADNALIIQLKGLQTMANRIGNTTYGSDVEVNQILELNMKYAELTRRIQEALASDEARSTGVIENLRSEIVELQNRSNALKQSNAAEEVVYATGKQRMQLMSQMQGWLERNTRAGTETKDSIRGMMAELSNPNLPLSRLQEMQTNLKTLEVQTKATGKAGKTFFDTFMAGLEKFGGWSLVTKTLTAVWRTMHRMYDAVVQLDTAMTELRRVTDLTEQGYKNFQKTAASVAKEIGATVSDTVNATADFARLGYDIEEAAELAKAALTYKNIGDGINDITEATESLVSTMAAFKELSADDAMYVVDMFNEVGNRFAISSQGIGDALQRSSAALSAAGNTIQESIGLVTAVNEIMQDPDSVGKMYAQQYSNVFAC